MKKTFFSVYFFALLLSNFSFSTIIISDLQEISPDPDSVPLTLSMCSNMLICEGDTIQIFGDASGGTGNYNYLWTPATNLSNPNISNPHAYPDSATTYTLTVNDGVSSISDSISIIVFYCPVAEIIASPNDTVGLDETILLNVGGDYLAYFWQDGSTDSTYLATNTSGPNGGEQVYWATIFAPSGCSASDTISVWFLPQVAVQESQYNPLFRIFQNPETEELLFYSKDYQGEVKIEVVNINGKRVYSETSWYSSKIQKSIPLSNLSSGFYVVRVQNMDGEVMVTEKILK